MRIAIVGSRSFDSYSTFKKLLTSIIKPSHISAIVSGGASGTDQLSEKFVYEFQIPELRIFIPQWLTYGKQAGYLRNKRIVDDVDMVIAFWDGKSKGTKMDIELAEKMNKILRVIRVDRLVEK